MSKEPEIKEILAGAYESAGQTTLVYVPGLEETVLSEAKGLGEANSVIHAGENGNRRMTVITVAYNHFGKFRHDRSKKVFTAVKSAIEASGMTLEIGETANDFSAEN